MSFGVLHLFAGSGGGAIGFARAGFDCVGAVDVDPLACADFDMFVSAGPRRRRQAKATVGDLSTMSAAELASCCTRRPDVVFLSPPCKGFAGLLPKKAASSDFYQALNALTLRGIMLMLEAWEIPPPLVVFENVPRITSARGEEWLDRIEKVLQAYGYSVERGRARVGGGKKSPFHDCGELGGLAQHRKRFLLVARHMQQVPSYLMVPKKKRVRAIGEVLGQLPVPLPGSGNGGPMHRLPQLSAKNWVRLALIPAGKDWKALPSSVRLLERDKQNRHNGPMGVNDWDAAAHTVVGHSSVRDPWNATSDPRLAEIAARHDGALGIDDWSEAAHTVTGQHGRRNWDSTSDPRLHAGPHLHRGVMGVRGWDTSAGCVRGNMNPRIGTSALGDPRLACTPEHGGHYGVQSWGRPSVTIRGSFGVRNSPASTSDPRVDETSELAIPRPRRWIATHEVQGDAIVGDAFDMNSERPCSLVIRAADGTFHRPYTTLELLALQGFPTQLRGRWVVLAGSESGSKKKKRTGWRERIGNAVPPPAAEAIARECRMTLLAAKLGGFLTHPGSEVWVKRGLRRGPAQPQRFDEAQCVA